MRHFSISSCNTVWDLLATHATRGLIWTLNPAKLDLPKYILCRAPGIISKSTGQRNRNQNVNKKKSGNKKNRKLNIGICGFVDANSHTPTPTQNPNHCPRGSLMLVAPELLFNFWEVFFFSPQSLGEGSGATGGLQVFRFIGMVTALLLIGIHIDAVQASKEQQQRQDHNNWRTRIGVRHYPQDLEEKAAPRNTDDKQVLLDTKIGTTFLS